MALITSTCPVCGALKSACGGHAEVSPVDDPTYLSRQENVMAQEAEPLQEYEYEVYGNTVTGQLSKADAERMGARPVSDDAEAKPEAKPTKARKAENK